MTIIFVLLVMGVIEIPVLVRQQEYKTLTVFSVCFAITLTLAVLIAAGVTLPSTLMLFGNVFKRLGLTY